MTQTSDKSEKNPDALETVPVRTSTGVYEVHVGPGALGRLGEVARGACAGSRCCVISDETVAALYADVAEASLAEAGFEVAGRLTFPAGEASKNLATLSELLEGLAARELCRDDLVVALGGGVTGDIAGLAAALYLRGCAVVQVPTSLLAMVDSSVGGKTAVDLAAGKNLAGAFWRPAAVVADVRCLATVPPELFRDSCGEVVKHAVLADPSLLDELAARPLTQSRLDEGRLTRVVARNVQIKRDVVEADERERGLRQTLNLGHTIGHAIESASELSLGHGSCVAAGLCMVARASEARGWCSADARRRIERCVAAHGLPTTSDLPAETLVRYLAHDKKRHGDGVNLVVPEDIGRVTVRRVSLDELARIVEDGRGEVRP
ncbi:3-dehydroquinate synthase [Olsenella sp. An290]|uniref:3-dehydroquinate synthase n=1 Tax=Olsenella sp. An290 TaxID=1965625 RepID=UPI000B36D997|nr:3-dehydroquinate synthase [Olsenella sp. An290]OUO34908.1 3-dehydroquinate synthase [Olsenella sp. An290]